jgi:hypothetical protein
LTPRSNRVYYQGAWSAPFEYSQTSAKNPLLHISHIGKTVKKKWCHEVAVAGILKKLKIIRSDGSFHNKAIIKEKEA